MKIKFGNTTKPVEELKKEVKPEIGSHQIAGVNNVQEELANKIGKFKFQTPKSQPQRETRTVSGTLASKHKPLASTTNQNAKVVQPKQKQQTPANQVAHSSVQAHPAIPELSADKYEVVVGQSDEFSEEAGNRFEEQIAILQAAVDGTGDLKDGMTNILTFLDDNPQYKETVEAKDMRVFVQACAKIANITVLEKKTRKTKKAKTSELEADIMNDLADLVIDL